MNAALLIFICSLISPISCAQCFVNKAELQAAVDSYVADPTSMNPTSVAHGFPIGTWCVGAVTDMSSLFQDKNNFDEDLSTWDVSSVTDMNAMFRRASAFNGDLSTWDVSSVTDMNGMFAERNVRGRVHVQPEPIRLGRVQREDHGPHVWESDLV